MNQNKPIQTLIIRHRKENRKKCTLTPLENHPSFQFISYPFTKPLPQLDHTILLTVDAPPLTSADGGHPLLLIDATWRYAATILNQLPPIPLQRSLPRGWQTAYARRQEVEAGLASIEALFAAFTILHWDTTGLLDHYYWREPFLEKNRMLILDCQRAKERDSHL